MRKLLLVHHERYLELAMRDVQDLLSFERRLTESNHVSDLLAVLLMSPQVINELLSPAQKCDQRCLGGQEALFGSDSVSVNGCWTLVTLNRHDFQEPRTREEALDRVLDILQTQGFVRDSGTVFRVIPFEEQLA
jgi:hypothetical protein